MYPTIAFSRFLSISLLLALLPSLLGDVLTVTPVRAASIVVNSNADTIADDGFCTLREAILNANADDQSGSADCIAGAGADTITFAADYTITLAGSQLPAVTSPITIIGRGQANIIIQANPNPNTAVYRVFEVAKEGSLTLNYLTVQHGRCNGSCATIDYAGGGIYNSGALIASQVTFNANTATGGGGIFNASGSSATLTNVAFSNNSAFFGSGGGISNASGSSATLTNVTFSNNSANFGGGGMINTGGSSQTLTNVTFSSNSADYGGGMYNASGSSPTLTNVTFSSNSADHGGGMYNADGSSPMLTNVTFSSNSAFFYGGGMVNYHSDSRLTKVIFTNNTTANYGGGMYNQNSSPTLIDVTFSSNSADYGGGMYNADGGSPTLRNVTFSNNSASFLGGGMVNYQSSPMLTNVTFSSNSADYGGGMYNDISSPTLTNVTFSGNAANYGGGMYNGASSSPRLNNVIIANSSGGDCLKQESNLDPASSNNLIEDSRKACGLTNGVNGNIIGRDPKLGPLASNGGFTQTHALLVGSPAIDTGTNNGCPTTDQRGIARPQGRACDIGAYEYFIARLYLPLALRGAP